ncbi:CO dehydrogenase/acetyl-CoA synthase delta subunit [Alkaliphilus peptidifermentans DSM 18978]|uniref:CO dehydrogenase/acetyl-CoA synthase delta subunit n=1 Tax=Alkaliphilus peptidifermentans DSM 18978 TaxID=1120976 RepID=A0A1G5LD09_9FIRM|nr:CO dehydrogenase/acetyl-CoA synthase delta subunit [Alkaliphilus peptidifermentans DSM 18978]
MAVRVGLGRFNYKISPGLYAIGNPDDKSEVLVTANYKLTIDQLRKELFEESFWVLVIDTNGVNVWCAAGKGTFSTEEVIYQVKKNKIEDLVSHRRLILPQLAAPGVVIQEIRKYTGFQPSYGPVRAADIKDFKKNGYNATEKMRRVIFNIEDRLWVSLLEFAITLKYLPIIYMYFVLQSMLEKRLLTLPEILLASFISTIPYFITIVIGTVVFAALLPYLPFRALSLKAAVLGFAWVVLIIIKGNSFLYSNLISIIGHSLLMISIISYLGLNFTGSTTYTSFSGVQKETLATVPILALSSVLGCLLLIVNLFVN